MNLKDYSNNGKFLKKAFSDYAPESQNVLSKKYTLLIKNINFKSNDYIDENIELVKKLTPKERTIVLCGVKQRLSYKRFYMLQLLLCQGKFDNEDYSDVYFTNNHFSNSIRTTSSNIKSFISKLKSVLENSIVKHYIAMDNFEKDDMVAVKRIINNLINNTMRYDQCTVTTNFVMRDRIHKM